MRSIKMETTFRRIRIVAVALAVASAVAACGAKSPSAAAPAAAPAAVEQPAAVPVPAVEAPKAAGKAKAKPVDPQVQAAQEAKAAEIKAAKEQKAAEAKAAEEQKAAQVKAVEEQKIAQVKAAEAAAKAAVEAKKEAARVAVLDVPDPVIATAGGVFGAPVTVTIDNKLKEAVVSYTIDGSQPGPNAGIRYAGPFTVSSSALVHAMAYIPNAKKSGVVSMDFTIGEVCVAPGGNGDGKRTAPLGSIAAGLAKAKALNIGLVKLAAGTITESVEVKEPITVTGSWKDGFSAQGGQRTIVQAASSGASSKKSPGYALRVAGKAADSKTRFERIEFRGSSASYGVGVVVSVGAAPEFAYCSTYGGSGSYGYGAVAAEGASPTFRSCRLDGGDGATSYGLSVDGAKATVIGSLILAGTGNVSGYGAVATDGSFKISGSVLAGNSANVSYGAALYNSKGSVIEGSTIVGGTGKDVAGVFVSTSDPAIENCVVSANGSAKSIGITANYGDSIPSKLAGNAFVGCSGGIYYEAQTKTSYAAVTGNGRVASADGKALPKPQGEGNALAAFSLGAAPSYAVPAGSAVKAGAPADLLASVSR